MYTVLINLFTGILTKLPPDTVKIALDKALDAIEDAIAKSSSTLDDQFVLPAIKWLRDQLDIEEEEGSPYADKGGDIT